MNIFRSIPAFLKVYFSINDYLSFASKRVDEAWAEGRHEDALRIIHEGENRFCERIRKKLNIKANVIGEENIPESGPYLIMANHQGYADIYAMLDGIRNRQIGFIAKKEFMKLKPLAKAIHYTGSIFINRGDARDAIKTVRETTERFKNGYTMCIFPEGTRSHSNAMRHFKPGSFKFAQKANVPILPISLVDSYKVFEEHNDFRAHDITMIIHPLYRYDQMDRAAQKQAPAEVEAIVRRGVEDYLRSQGREMPPMIEDDHEGEEE